MVQFLENMLQCNDNTLDNFTKFYKGRKDTTEMEVKPHLD